MTTFSSGFLSKPYVLIQLDRDPENGEIVIKLQYGGGVASNDDVREILQVTIKEISNETTVTADEEGES